MSAPCPPSPGFLLLLGSIFFFWRSGISHPKLLTEDTILTRLGTQGGLLGSIAVPVSCECATFVAHGLTGGAGALPPPTHQGETVFHSLTLSASIKLSFWLRGDSQDIPKSTELLSLQPWTLCTKAVYLCPCN